MTFLLKFKGIKFVLFIYFLIFTLGCNSEKKQKGYFLVSYYYMQDGVYNIELCKFNNYKVKKTLEENLANTDKMQCFVIPYSDYDDNFKYIQQLRGIKKKNKFKEILCRVDFEIVDTNPLSYHFSNKDSFIYDSIMIKIDYYFLSMYGDKVIFHHFEPIDSITLK